METLISIKPLLVILAPLVAGFLIIMDHNKPNRREFWSILAGVIMFVIVMIMAPDILAGKTIQYTLFTLLPGVRVSFRVDSLGLLFATTASFLWILTTLFSIGYMRGTDEVKQARYFHCFAIALTATMGIAFSSNLFTLYLFYEILSLWTYPHVIHKEHAEAWAGGKKYIIYLMGCSKLFLLAALILTYLMTGTLEFSRGGIFPEGLSQAHPVLLTVTYFLFLFGLAKAALMPVHSWLPTAMIAPTPVSALLHAVAVVKVGVFSIVRVMLDVYGVDLLGTLHLGVPTAVLASITILTASVFALTEDNLKFRLAYSTVSQLSYVMLGVALLTPGGISGGIFQIVNHAFGKITLFFCAGAIYVATHYTRISQLGGLGRRMPVTMGAFFLGSMSMIGIPPVAGFVSKWYLLNGSLSADQTVILVVILTSALLNVAYFMPIIYKAYFGQPEPGHEQTHDHPEEGRDRRLRMAVAFCVFPPAVAAVLSVFNGIYPAYFLKLIQWVVQS